MIPLHHSPNKLQSNLTLQYYFHLKVAAPGLPLQYNVYLKEKKIKAKKKW